MRNLISANFNRLLKNRAFWLSVIIMTCIEGIFYWRLSRSDDFPMDTILLFSFECFGILVAVFLSSFLGTEYSDGTIRNKLIVGHKRSSIYLASLITGITAITIIYLASALIESILILFGAPHNSIGRIMLSGGIVWFACISFVSIFNLVGMLSSSKALTAIICLLTAFALLFSGFYMFSLLSIPDYLVGAERAIYQILLEFNPSGQILQIIFGIVMPWKLVTYSLLLSFVLTCLGLYIFHKKDLK